MHVWWAVLKELWQFLLEALDSSKPVVAATAVVDATLNPKPQKTLAEPTLQPADGRGAKVSAHLDQYTNQYAYVRVPVMLVWKVPVFNIDGVIKRLPLGTRVSVIGTEDQLSRVMIDDEVGWVLTADITCNENEVFPILSSGTVYHNESPITRQIREVIADEWVGGELGLSLLDVELVTYLFKLKKLQLPWSNERPRVAGMWHQLLKGKPGVHIGITPRTGSIMEYFDQYGMGHVGFVAAVSPANAVTVQSVGRLREGEYLSEILNREEWQNLRPVWITAT